MLKALKIFKGPNNQNYSIIDFVKHSMLHVIYGTHLSLEKAIYRQYNMTPT